MSNTVVSTPNGKIEGKLYESKQKDAKPVYIYRNVPFAKPPVGNLRFMPPEPAEPWKGMRDGTELGNKPMYDQMAEEMVSKLVPFGTEEKSIHNEDCLHASIYTPSIKKDKKLPVMVWFYGGGFGMGSERDYDGSVLAGLHNVVVVVPNYRVGVFGFLSLGPSSICPGNQGIKDQQLFLKWVQGNIDAFGGDKDNVTIFGESAGSISVSMHVTSPLSRGLFHKAIGHSGTGTIPGIILNERIAAKNVRRLLEHAKIEERDDKKVLEVLQKMPADDLVAAASSMELMMEKVNFQPIYGDAVFPKSQEESLKSKDFVKVPYIIGCNSTEGHGLLSMVAGPDFAKGLSVEVAKKSLYIPITDEGFEKCKKFYLKPDDKDKTRYSKMFGDIMGDGMFVAPSIQLAKACSGAGSNVYVYYGNFRTRMFHDKQYGGDLPQKVEWCICDHGDDIQMTFGIPLSEIPLRYGSRYNDDEKKLSKEFMTYLTNFARTGDPNKGKKVKVAWPKYQPKVKAHLELATPISVGRNLSQKQVDFWLDEMPKHRYLLTKC